MDAAEHGLHNLLLEWLVADPGVDDRVDGLVLAAWESDEDLALPWLKELGRRPT